MGVFGNGGTSARSTGKVRGLLSPIVLMAVVVASVGPGTVLAEGKRKGDGPRLDWRSIEYAGEDRVVGGTVARTGEFKFMAFPYLTWA